MMHNMLFIVVDVHINRQELDIYLFENNAELTQKIMIDIENTKG